MNLSRASWDDYTPLETLLKFSLSHMLMALVGSGQGKANTTADTQSAHTVKNGMAGESGGSGLHSEHGGSASLRQELSDLPW